MGTLLAFLFAVVLTAPKGKPKKKTVPTKPATDTASEQQTGSQLNPFDIPVQHITIEHKPLKGVSLPSATSAMEFDGIMVSEADIAGGIQAYATSKENFFAICVLYFQHVTAGWAQNQASLTTALDIFTGCAQIAEGIVSYNVADIISGVTQIVTGAINQAKAASANQFDNYNFPTPPNDPQQWDPAYGWAPHQPNGATLANLVLSYNQFIATPMVSYFGWMAAKYNPDGGNSNGLFQYCRTQYAASAQGQADYMVFLTALAYAATPAAFGGSNSPTIVQQALPPYLFGIEFSGAVAKSTSSVPAPRIQVFTGPEAATATSAAWDAATDSDWAAIEAGETNDADARPIPGLTVEQSVCVAAWTGGGLDQYWG